MIFLEEYARPLLLLHTALAVAAVGAATHLALWTRGYWRGRFARHGAVRRFAGLTLALYAAAFVVGNAIYPTYRVRVRAEYLDHPTAVAEETAARARASAAARQAHSPASAGEGAEVLLDTRDASRARAMGALRAARWFDVKEHWLAMGLLVAAALTFLLWRWDPRRDGEGAAALGPVVALLGACTALAAWAGAIIGVLTSAWRAI